MNSQNSKKDCKNKAGLRIRAYRERHDWSIYDLSQKSGVDEKTINAIEKGEVMPALGILVKIAQALGQRLGTFMDDQFKPDRHMDPFRIEFEADGVDTLSAHEGEELIICLAGEVELSYGPDKTVLKAGDTAYYNSCVKHGLRALGGKPASIYGIVFVPA